MALTVVGISHHGAPLSVRERVALRTSEVAPTLSTLRSEAGVREAVVLSTCNRTEFYLEHTDTAAVAAVWNTLSAKLGDDASRHGYVLRDRDAVGHLFRVASGLDSMILGEAQIHGQVKAAWESCRPFSGIALNRLFQTAAQVAGRIRAETGVGRGAASVSSAAVQLAKQIFGALAGRRAMVLGAGEMAELALECLADEGVRAAVVANRTHERAITLAERFGATAVHYDECWRELGSIDLLLCSTAAPHAIVTRDLLEPGLAARGGRPLCILDIALPRDVDPGVAAIENVFLYDLDDLQAVVDANLERRRAELPEAERMIAAESERYLEWLAGLSVVPVLTHFRHTMDEVRARELNHALRRLGELTPQQREQLEYFSRALMNKFLHEPTVRLRAAAADHQELDAVAALRFLFALDESGSTSAADDAPVEPLSRASGDA